MLEGSYLRHLHPDIQADADLTSVASRVTSSIGHFRLQCRHSLLTSGAIRSLIRCCRAEGTELRWCWSSWTSSLTCESSPCGFLSWAIGSPESLSQLFRLCFSGVTFQSLKVIQARVFSQTPRMQRLRPSSCACGVMFCR
jgi:hypothetical protein